MRMSDIKENQYYSLSSVSKLVLMDGRRMDEALRNHPFAPKEACKSMIAGSRANGKYFIGIDLINFANQCNKSSFQDTPEHIRVVADEVATMRAEYLELEKAIVTAQEKYFDMCDRIADAKKTADFQIEKFFSQYMRRSNDLLTNGKICGVYFLKNEDRVVYVGQSRNILARIGQHQETKVFDAVSFVKCKEENLNCVEGFFISLLTPPLNGTVGPRSSINKFEDITHLLIGVHHAAE